MLVGSFTEAELCLPKCQTLENFSLGTLGFSREDAQSPGIRGVRG